jgi:hypothetical protein
VSTRGRGAADTDPAAAAVLLARLRQLTPAEKLAQVVALNAAVEELTSAGIRAATPDGVPVSPASVAGELARRRRLGERLAAPRGGGHDSGG